MTIDCFNKPDLVISDIRGDGFLRRVPLTTVSSFPDLSENYFKTVEPFSLKIPTTTAIDEYGREETAEALATVITEWLAPNRINAYNRAILDGNISDPSLGFNKIIAIPVTEQPPAVPELVINASPVRDAFFQNALPGINERLKIGPLSPVEFAEFARESGYADMNAVVEDSRKNPFSFLNLLNSVLAATSLFGSLGGICELLSNPFAGLTGIIESSLDKLKKIQDLKDSILGALDGIGDLLSGGLDVLKSLRDKAFSKIEGFIEGIPKMMESIIDSVKSKFNNLTNKFNDFANKVKDGLQGNVLKQIGKTIQRKMNQVRNFLSKNNMETLINKAKESIGRFAGQFKDMTVNIADFILFNGCKMVGAVNDFLSAPVDSLKNLLSKSENEIQELALFSGDILKDSVAAGRPHIPAAEAARLTNDFREQRRSAAVASVQQQGGYIPPNLHFDVQLVKTTHPDPISGWQHLKFDGQVLDPVQQGQKFWDWDTEINMVDYGGGTANPSKSGVDNAIGYYGIDLETLERGEALGKALVDIGAEELDGAPPSMRSEGKLYINSGFRHEIYNQYLRNTMDGVAKNSQHMKGMALDCKQGRGRFRGAFVTLAKAHGFGAVGFYNTFVHIDRRPGPRTWGDSSGSSYVPPNLDDIRTPETTETVVAPEQTETVPPVNDTPPANSDVPLEPGETLVGVSRDPETGVPTEKIVTVTGVDADGFSFTETKTVRL